MREMYIAMKLLSDKGWRSDRPGDRREVSGPTTVFRRTHFSRGRGGSPLAIVRDGDSITIDIPARKLHLHVSDEEIKAVWPNGRGRSPKFKKGYLASTRDWRIGGQGAIIRNKSKRRVPGPRVEDSRV